MATARCSSPANYPEINGTTSSASRRSPTPSSIASSTTPIGWNWTGRPCANSKPPSRPKLMLDHPRRKPPGPYLRQPSQQKGIRNDRRAQLPARPGGSTGTSRARRCASREGAPRHARVPPIDYRDGLSPSLTNQQENDITTIIQRRRQHPRHTGRDRSEQVVAIRRNRWSRSSVCPIVERRCCSEKFDDLFDGLIGAVIGGFETAVGAVLGVGAMVEASGPHGRLWKKRKS